MNTTIKRRSFGMYILLNLITCGIYGIVVFCQMGDDVNKICEGDGQDQMSYILAWLLGGVTFGIVPLVWVHKAMNRLKDNAYRYNVHVDYAGSDYILWTLLGMFIFVGPFIAVYHYMEDLNQFCVAYDQVVPAPYTYDIGQRATLKPTSKVNNGYPVGNGAPNYAYTNNGGQNQNGYQNAQPAAAVNGQGAANAVQGVGPTEAYNNNVGRGKLTCLSGMYQGSSFPMQNNEVIRIGKDPTKANIIIDDSHVSSLHCAIQFDATSGTYFVTDYSTNGTYLSDGQRLNRNEPARLAPGTVIMILDNRNSFKLN